MGSERGGPLRGLRVLELAGLGPAPYAAMLLADYGADVIRIDRPPASRSRVIDPSVDLLNRGKRSVSVDLSQRAGAELLLGMLPQADVLLEGNRPGVVERMGLGPQECLRVNPGLVYGRMTGWGQDGPYAGAAGHDLNYIAVTGALHGIGQDGQPPQIPLNVVGDFAGGGAFLAMGVMAALREASETGRGQVVDAAIIDGVSHLLTIVHAMLNEGTWTEQRQANMIDGGAPFYAVYETADGKYLSLASIEPKFFAEFVRLAGIDFDVSDQYVRATWPTLRQRIAETIQTRSLAGWQAVFDGTDACVAPVFTFTEAMDYPQVRARGSVLVENGQIQSAVAPRFSGHPQLRFGDIPLPGQHSEEILREFSVAQVDQLIEAKVVHVS